jgi:hypothetical protein
MELWQMQQDRRQRRFEFATRSNPMKTSAPATFALSLMFSAVLFACLALAGDVKQRPAKSSSARAKAAAAKRARAKPPAKPAPPEQDRLFTPPPVVRRLQLPERYDSPREAAAVLPPQTPARRRNRGAG